jgi:hypothetical protein
MGYKSPNYYDKLIKKALLKEYKHKVTIPDACYIIKEPWYKRFVNWVLRKNRTIRIPMMTKLVTVEYLKELEEYVKKNQIPRCHCNRDMGGHYHYKEGDKIDIKLL